LRQHKIFIQHFLSFVIALIGLIALVFISHLTLLCFPEPTQVDGQANNHTLTQSSNGIWRGSPLSKFWLHVRFRVWFGVLILDSIGFRLVAMSNSLILSMEFMKKKLPISSKPSSLRIIWSSKMNYVFTHMWKIWEHVWSSSLKESKNCLLEGYGRCRITHSPHPSSLHLHKNGKSHFPLSTLIGRVYHLVQPQWTMPLSTLVLPNCFLSWQMDIRESPFCFIHSYHNCLNPKPTSWSYFV
jgi:hypothetical protein